MCSRSKPVALAVALVVAATVPAAGQASRPFAGCAPDAKAANLNFTLQDLDGNDVTLSAYKGKVILLDFWATWCGPCKVEIPGFIELFSKYRSQGLQVLGFAVDDPVPALKAYANELGMNYPVLVGNGRNDVLQAFGPMVGLPTTIIIARDGTICARHTGFTPKDRFERQVRALLPQLF